MALLPLRRFRLVEYRHETPDTFTLVLEPADGQPMFSFLAGQFVMLHFFNPDGTPWAKAAYSIATAPVESQTSFELGIKLDGDFTKRCAELKSGDEVHIQGPYGMFVLKPDTKKLVFFAGGIGVTPLRSMIREVLLTKKPIEMLLLYSDRCREQLAYEQEFRDLAAHHPNFRSIFILTRDQSSEWDGERGRMNPLMVKKYLSDFQIRRYCMCGPTEYMNDIRDMLLAEGVDVKTQVQRESFG